MSADPLLHRSAPETVEVPVGDLVAMAQEVAELKSALYAAIHSMTRAQTLITPGMKAGTAEASDELGRGVGKAWTSMRSTRDGR